MGSAWWLEPRRNRRPPGATKRGPHSLGTVRGIAAPVCTRCGLVALRNPATAYALRLGCWRYRDE